MAKHLSKKEQVNLLIKDISELINKKNVDYAIPLLQWTLKKFSLISNAESKKSAIRVAKQTGGIVPEVLKISRGEIWDAELGTNIGSEQCGNRPVLIVQNDVNNKRSPNTIIVPLSKIENRQHNDQPLTEEELLRIEEKLRVTEVLLRTYDVVEGEANLSHPSIVLTQNIRELSKERLNFKITNIDPECWERINNALKASIGLD